MAKLKHNRFLDTVDEVFTYAKNLKILHLNAEGSSFDGRHIQVNGKKLKHFGTTGYLGLEQDQRLKDAAIEAIQNYGTQFPLSKSYISHPLYAELEHLLNQIYEQPVVISKNATLAHMAAIPVLVEDRDAILLDHQVHWSVQDAAKRLKLRGVKIELVRHNRLDLLEKKIQEISSKVNHIWYMADGVYSMYGDYSPVEQLMELSKKYKQLHLYFDDVHGMSWKGKMGRGFVYDQLFPLSKKVVVIATLSKTFGANGSFIVCGDIEKQQKIKTFGGPLTFSAQLDPASVGAAIAAAKIHLSTDIIQLQNKLQKKISLFKGLIKQYQLPLVDENDSPVFFLATGVPETGYQLTKALMKEGFYVNMGLFPAVPSKNIGLRITLSNHNHATDIKSLARSLKKLYPVIMNQTGNTYDKLNRAFQKKFTVEKSEKKNLKYSIQTYSSIQEIDKNLWDRHFQGEALLNWEGFKFLEKSFTKNKLPENNWEFLYIKVFNSQKELIALAAFTISIWKDDLLAKPQVSELIEQQRKANPYQFTSKVLSLGSLFTDGLPLKVLDQENQAEIFHFLLDQLDLIMEEKAIEQIVLRDFEVSNAYQKVFQSQGYIPIQMPDLCIINKLAWKSEEEYLQRLSKKSRKHFKKDIEAYQRLVTIEIVSKVNQEQLEILYQLYQNVKEKNLDLNTFLYPKKVFEHMNISQAWEFILLYPKEKMKGSSDPIGVMFCFKGNKPSYVPSLVGLNYEFNHQYQTYRQLLYESIKRAGTLNYKNVDFGISASFEKRKLGAEVLPQMAYIQAKNNFKLDYIESQIQ